jgi:hypothetical protein
MGTLLSGSDEDWSSFTLSATTPVTIMLSGLAIQDIDLALFDSTGTTALAASASAGSSEAVATTLAAGTYTVRVTPLAITGTPRYTLLIQ